MTRFVHSRALNLGAKQTIHENGATFFCSKTAGTPFASHGRPLPVDPIAGHRDRADAALHAPEPDGARASHSSAGSSRAAWRHCGERSRRPAFRQTAHTPRHAMNGAAAHDRCALRDAGPAKAGLNQVPPATHDDGPLLQPLLQNLGVHCCSRETRRSPLPADRA